MNYGDLPAVVITIQIGPRKYSRRGGWVTPHQPQPAKAVKKPKQREYSIPNMLSELHSLNNYKVIDQGLIDLVIERGNEHPRKVWQTIRGLEGYLKSRSVANQFLSVKETRDLIFHSIDRLQPPRDNTIIRCDSSTRGMSKNVSEDSEVQLGFVLFP